MVLSWEGLRRGRTFAISAGQKGPHGAPSARELVTRPPEGPGAGGQGRAAPPVAPVATLTPGQSLRCRPSAHSRHVAAGCQDSRRGRSENNRPLMFSFQEEGVAIVGNFCDRQSWLIVRSPVSQALAPSRGPAWPPCAASLAGAQAPLLPGLPSLRGRATVSPDTSSCGSASRSSPESFRVLKPLLALATAPAAPCPAGHPLCGAHGGCGACATSRLALAALAGCSGAAARAERCAAAGWLPAPACASACGWGLAGLGWRPPEPTRLLCPAQRTPVALCWSCLWFPGR